MARKNKKDISQAEKSVVKPVKQFNKNPHASKSEVLKNDDIPKVKLDLKLEAALLELVKSKNREDFEGKKLSSRITKRKLTEIYDSVSNAGFNKEWVERGMGEVVGRGGDVIDVLDWLCLNMKNEDLPDDFSQVLKREEDKIRPKFVPHIPRNGRNPDGTKDINFIKIKANQPEMTRKVPKVSMKDWILKYSTQYSDEEEGDGIDEEGNGIKGLFGCEGNDEFNSAYLEKVAKYRDLEKQTDKYTQIDTHTQTDTNTHKDIENMRRLHKQMENYVGDLISMQRHKDFDPRHLSIFNSSKEVTFLQSIKPQKKVKKREKEGEKDDDDDGDNDEEGGGGGMMGMFDEEEGGNDDDDGVEQKAEKVTTKLVKETNKNVKVKLDVRDFEYTRQQWTGKSPKQFLHDWVSKKAKGSTLSYSKVDVGGGKWRSRCKLSRPTKQGDNLEVTPDQVCFNIKDAEHVSSALMLYQLCKGQDIHLLLPPPYREVWLEWRRNDEVTQQVKLHLDTKPRDDYVEKLFARIEAEKLKTERKDVDDDDGDDGDDDDDGDGDDDDGDDDWENYKLKKGANQDEDEDGNDEAVKGKPLEPQIVHRILKTRQESLHLMLQNRKSKSFSNLLTDRQDLPVYKYKEKILNMFKDNSIFIVSGETGSGKSTQVPQFVLEHLLTTTTSTINPMVICTQPRRISAISLARRVAMEMGEGEGPGGRRSLIGYQIRSEVQKSLNTRLLYCTTGVLLRKMQLDVCVEDVECIVVDEVHERDLNTDVLLIHLLDLLNNPLRKNLKVILMSATLDCQRFSQYFNHCAIINVEGRSHPVEVMYMEDIVEMSGYQLELDSLYSLPYETLVEEQSTTVNVTGRAGLSSQMEVTWSKHDVFKIDKTDLEADKYSLRTRNTLTRLNDDLINVDLLLEAIRYVHVDGCCDEGESSNKNNNINNNNNNNINNNNNNNNIRGLIGSVLVFLPGLSMIEKVREAMLGDVQFGDPSKFLILPLHSVLSTREQSLVFSAPPPNTRKIILSTNISETGLTIPDVVYVLDCGREKQQRYMDSSRMSQLRQVWISQASGRQRSGRAGRVKSGVCIRLYSKLIHQKMPSHTTPEIKRLPLQGLCLHVMKSYSTAPSDFLLKALDPPTLPSINVAMNILQEVGACEGCSLTPLGHHLAGLPVDARLGKMLVFAGILGCLKEASIMVACVTEKSPFMSRLESTTASSTFSPKTPFNFHNSDQLATFEVVNKWMGLVKKSERMDYVKRNNLKSDAMRDIENTSKELEQLITSCNLHTNLSNITNKHPSFSSHFKTPQPSKHPSSTLSRGMVKLLKGVLLAGLYPNLGRVVKGGGGGVCEVVVDGKDSLRIHPSSINRKLDAKGEWIVFQDKEVLNNKACLLETTQVESVGVLLFGGCISVQHQQQVIYVGKNVTFKAPAKVGVLFKELRLMLDEYLRHKLNNNNNNNKINNNKINKNNKITKNNKEMDEKNALNDGADEKLLVLLLEILIN